MGKRYSLRTLMLVITFTACTLAGFRYVYQNSFFYSEPPGYVTNQLEWPRTLKELVSDVKLDLSEADSFIVYRIFNGAFGEEYVWQFKLSSKSAKAVVEKLSLELVEDKGRVSEFVDKKIPEKLLLPERLEKCEVYITPGFLDVYMELDVYIVFHDLEQETLTIWYRFTF